jgi:type I restriction enzyme S subunit
VIEELKPYSDYKPVDSRWIPRAPAHWEVKKLRALTTPRSERNRPDLPLLSVARERGVFVRTEDDGNHNYIPDDLSNYKVARAGSLVINKMKAWQGSMGIAPTDGIVSPAYFVYELRVASRLFGQALLRSRPYVAHFGQASDGVRVGQWDLSITRMREIPILLPPPEEQEAIVRFLAHANRRIDQFIRTKKKLIALLNEQKQAIIHRAVTRGLDPGVAFKESGVPWIPPMPVHWKVARFKNHVAFQEGPGIMAADFRTRGVPLLRIAGLRGDTASLHGCNFLEPSMVADRWSHFRVRPGDYLLSSSASTGKVVLATDAVAGAIPYTGIIRLWQRSNETHMPFVCHYVGSRPFQDQIDAAKSGVGIEHFGPTHLRRMIIAMPPAPEQIAIARYAADATRAFDPLVDAEQREIELVREYRARLISDVVTGQLDVRGAAASLPTLELEGTQTEPDPDEEVVDIDDTEAA